eukprot:2101777-Lingulodinium_polyedra.AAC.1
MDGWPAVGADSGAAYCIDCRTRVDGAEQWSTRTAGKKHRRNADRALQPRFTDDQRYWAKQAARNHLQLLYTRYSVLLARLAG